MLQRLIGEDILLETNLDPALDLVEADPGQMNQVLLNLSVNARDAMPDGGRLVLATANARFDAENAPPGCQPGAYVKLTVADTGTGMDEETMQHLFEPFFTTKPSGLGTGLGLATVYGIVKQSGGSIRVHNEPGKGCRFEIHLPCAEGPAEPVSARGHRTASTPAGTSPCWWWKTRTACAAWPPALSAPAGTTSSKPPAAMRRCASPNRSRAAASLVVTDVIMPGISGKTLAEELRARWPDIKVLFMSGYPNDVILRHGVMDGAVNYLEKPFTPSELAAKVREVMG